MKASPPPVQAYARVVVETNVLLSAALSPHGAPARLVDRVLELGRLVFSSGTFAELETRLWLPKFDRYLSLESRRRLLGEASASALWVEIPAALAKQTYSRDAADDVFIHTALAAQVTRLVSGGGDLLSLHPLGELHILTARAALDELGLSTQ